MSEKWYRLKCACGRSHDVPGCCVRARSWLHRVYDSKGKKFDYDTYRRQYEELARLPLKGSLAGDAEQVKKDLGRTFPLRRYFCDRGAGQRALERILVTFAKYDPRVGYVQGMNFLAGALLFHASEAAAFWLFVALLEDYELRDAFLPGMLLLDGGIMIGLPGLYKHTQIIDLLIFENLHDVYMHFVLGGT